MLRQVGLIMLSGCLVLATGMMRPQTARALEVQCIEPSKYKHLYLIFGNDRRKLVQYLRLNEAKRRLSSHGKTLHTVAASVGFPSTTAFTRAYQKRFGASPRQAGAIVPVDFGQR